MNWECSRERAGGGDAVAGVSGGPKWHRQRLIHEVVVVGGMVMMRTDTSHMRPPLTVQGSPSGMCSGLPAHAHTLLHKEIKAHERVIYCYY